MSNIIQFPNAVFYFRQNADDVTVKRTTTASRVDNRRRILDRAQERKAERGVDVGDTVFSKRHACDCRIIDIKTDDKFYAVAFLVTFQGGTRSWLKPGEFTNRDAQGGAA